MDKRPLIGILVTHKKHRKTILELHKRFNDLNVRVFSFTPADIVWEKRKIIGLGQKKGSWKQRSYPFPDAVYNRGFNKKITTLQRLELAIGKNKCFNTVNHFNKWELYNQLTQSWLSSHLPDTFLYKRENIASLIAKYKILYLKPFYGSKGESVHRIELMDNGDVHISLHCLAPCYICRENEEVPMLLDKLDKLAGLNNYIIQQGVRTEQLGHHYFDLRVLAQKGVLGNWSVTAITSRVAYKDYFNTSMCESIYDSYELLGQLLSTEERDQTLEELYDLAIQAAKSAESSIGLLGELSVDFVIDKQKKLWIIELNGKPQKDIYKDLKSPELTKRIYSSPLQFAYYISQL
ncbi:YheC/YheD family protein [Paenibacillus paridis]|uniref:YheC/YheD family endospore coat-associated protein n=1 Tax=Paenibacillus paridis TaxID=2583376 RepID=UPI00112415CA|nr:YheC/YheD family protein [Paenibacillus paridis]